MRLSDGALRSMTLPPGAVQFEVPDEGCRGLVLVIGARSKAWQVRFSLNGRRHRYVIGRYPSTSLAEARAAASAAMLQVDRGEDPRTATTTVSQAWAAHWPRKAETLRHPDHDLAAWKNHIAPVIGAMDLADLSPLTYDRLVDAWRAKGLGPGQSKPRRVLLGFQKHLLARRLIDRPFVHSDVVIPVSQQPAIPPLDVVLDLWRWCEGRGAVGAILRLLIASGARSAMISDLRVSEVQDDALVWPAARMKGGRPFACPISPAMRQVLDGVTVPPGSTWVFPSRERTGPIGVDLSVHIAKSPLAGFRMHSLRAALVTHGGDRFGWPPHVRVALLDHSPAAILGSGVTASYIQQDGRLYWDDRAAALEAWGTLLTGEG